MAVEVRKHTELPNPDDIARAIRIQYYVAPHSIVFVPPRTIKKTTSGKIARSITRQHFLEGKLPVIATHTFASRQEPANGKSGRREHFQYLAQFHNLTGSEEYTFAETGMDSLTLVQLLLDIKQLLKEHGASHLIDRKRHAERHCLSGS